MPKITFFLRQSVLYCRITLNSKTSEFSIGEKINPLFWNQKAQTYNCKDRDNREYIVSVLENTRNKIRKQNLMIEATEPGAIVESLKPKKVIAEILLSELAETFILAKRKELNFATVAHYVARLENLKKFEKHKKQQFSPSTFTLPVAEDFKKWFCLAKNTSNITTASRNIEMYCAALQFAVKNGVINDFALSYYEPERDKIKKPMFLTSIEIETLIQTKMPNEKLDRAKDLYLFQLGSGLSYIDLYSDWKIKEGNTCKVLTGSRGKNSTLYMVPVCSMALAVMAKYNNKLPTIKNQPYNRYLKQIAEFLGIKKLFRANIMKAMF